MIERCQAFYSFRFSDEVMMELFLLNDGPMIPIYEGVMDGF